MKKIKTRFAPSPTGFLHIGGVRTALFCYLFAKKHQGEFILRIEDTDVQRNVSQASEIIIDAIDWLGLTPSIEPIYQSSRQEIYRTYLEQLFNQDKAYVCTCSKERLETLRNQALKEKRQPKYDGHCSTKNHPFRKDSIVRLKVNQSGKTSFKDLTHRNLSIDNSQLDDLVIYRSSMPTYNFSVVIDDALMQISHVIRGDDHINNTFRQISLFQALGFEIPLFSHLPMILNPDGSRLSKRNDAANVLDYQTQGYLPEAILNYLFRLGFSHGDQEVFSINEMIEVFDLAKVNASAASINQEKLIWLNQHYIQKMDNKQLYQIIQNQAKSKSNSNSEVQFFDSEAEQKHLACLEMQKSRAKTLNDFADLLSIFYQNEPLSYQDSEVIKGKKQITKEQLQAVIDAYENLQSFNQQAIHQVMQELVDQFFAGQFGKLARTIRMILTAKTASGDLTVGMSLMGKERVLSRLKHFLALIEVD